jgi:hypothetical protein
LDFNSGATDVAAIAAVNTGATKVGNDRRLVHKSTLESCFCKGVESALGRLEKPLKNPIYSITCW